MTVPIVKSYCERIQSLSCYPCHRMKIQVNGFSLTFHLNPIPLNCELFKDRLWVCLMFASNSESRRMMHKENEWEYWGWIQRFCSTSLCGLRSTPHWPNNTTLPGPLTLFRPYQRNSSNKWMRPVPAGIHSQENRPKHLICWWKELWFCRKDGTLEHRDKKGASKYPSKSPA